MTCLKAVCGIRKSRYDPLFSSLQPHIYTASLSQVISEQFLTNKHENVNRKG